MSEETLKIENVELTGRLITSVDPTQLGKGDFQSLSNMRYTNASIKAIAGMTKINNNSILSGCHVLAAKHFVKDFPPESHVLVHAANPSFTASAIYDGLSVVPGMGEFIKLVDLSGAAAGTFSDAPDGCVAFGNGSDLLIWGGQESRCAGFVLANTDDVTGQPTQLFDYTSEVTDSDTTTVALMKELFIHVASTRALQGIKFYVSGHNTIPTGVTVSYWGSDNAWHVCSDIVDHTAVGPTSLSVTGEVTFDSTVGTAQLRYFNSTLAYWYLVTFTGMNANTKISYCSVDAPPQAITDIWDGVPRTITSFLMNDGSIYNDYTSKVINKDFVSGQDATYTGILADSTLYAGFVERMRGISIYLAPGQVNSNDLTMSVSYWNGSNWIALSFVDGTTNGTTPLSLSGVITWTPPLEGIEFVRGGDTSGTTLSKDLFYYYKISFSLTVNATCFIDYISGIPAGKKIDRFAFPAMFQNRLVLCNNQASGANTSLIGGANTSSVFNGSDSTTIFFGDDRAINAAAPFFSRFSNNFFENLVVFKPDSVWVVDGQSPSEYKTFKIAGINGCAAPATLTACDIGFTGIPGSTVTRNILIWQSSSAICMFEGSVVIPIHTDIEDVFDQTKSYAVSQSVGKNSTAFFDVVNREWHWLYPPKGGTDENSLKELVFDVVRKKWYTVDRGTGNRISVGFTVIDTNNNNYSYGACKDGFIKRLENGQTFNGTEITASFQTGDIPLGGWMTSIFIRKIKPIVKSKNVTQNKLQLSYYGDSSTSPLKTIQFNVGDTTHRIVQTQPLKPNVESIASGDYVFHSFKASMTTNNEDVAFEPIGIGVLYHPIRQEVK